MFPVGLKEQLANDLKDAIRQRDEPRKIALRMTLTAIRYLEAERGIISQPASGQQCHSELSLNKTADHQSLCTRPSGWRRMRRRGRTIRRISDNALHLV